MTERQIAAELEDFYRSYIDAFNREDIDQLTRCFTFPYGWLSGHRGLIQCTSEGDHQRRFGQIISALKQRGWQRSVTDRFTCWPYAQDLAMILADVTRYRTDGSSLERVRASYMAARHEQGWRLITIAEIQSPFLGPGNIPWS